MDKRQLLVLRMADLLWERYTVHGLAAAATAIFHDGHKNQPEVNALANTALATYKQFCARHGIETGL